jgi:alkane 1-monooxygenase
VATLKDPASARLGESLYTFVPRSIFGNLKDGVMMEMERLAVRKIPFFSLQNRYWNVSLDVESFVAFVGVRVCWSWRLVLLPCEGMLVLSL